MTNPKHLIELALALALIFVASAAGPWAHAADDIPANLTAEVRLFEARSVTPDFQAMQQLSFFINTDGIGVTEDQWLATVARQVPDAFLATLAFEILPASASTTVLRVGDRSRGIELSLDFSGFTREEAFEATVKGELTQQDEVARSFEHTIELRLGQTYVWSHRSLELSASEYLSHFRDYRDSDHRAALYDELRNFATFLIAAVSLRATSDAERPLEPVELELPDDVDVPNFESPFGVDLIGTVELELVLDGTGAPTDAKIARSTIPELNSQILDEAERWRFPEARGRTGRLTLELEAPSASR